MAANIPAAILDKMRPAEFSSGKFLEYFRLLEQKLIQIEDQIGNSSSEVSGIPDVDGRIFINDGFNPSEINNLEFVSISSDYQTKFGVIIECTASLTVTLNPEPDGGETVYIYCTSNDVEIVAESGIPILGVSNIIGKVGMFTAFEYHLNSNKWIQKTLSAKASRGIKYVYTADDFDTPIRGDVTYFIDGIINLGSKKLVVGTGGLSIDGLGFGRSFLVSSENSYTMIESDTGGSGDVEFRRVSFTASGAGSRVLGVTDHDNNSAIDILGCNFISCTSIGYIDGYRQFFADIIAAFGCGDGIEFRNPWAGGAKLTNALVRGAGSNFTMFKAGAGLTFGSRFYTDLNIDLPTGTTSSISDFSPSNFTKSNQLQINSAQVTRNGSVNIDDAFYFPNISHADVESYWQSNSGIRNTVIGGIWTTTAEAATTVSADSTYYKLAGTTTYSNLIHMSNTTDNAFVFDSDVQSQMDIFSSLEILGIAGDEISVKIRVWDNSLSSYVDYLEITKPIVNYPSTSDRAVFTLVGEIVVGESDRVEIWVANMTAARDVTMALGSLCRVRA